MKYKPKTRKYSGICVLCHKPFQFADVKAKRCSVCRAPKLCRCGCGKMVTSKGKFYAPGCQIRGKSYKDIGGKQKNCGFKKGRENPNYNFEMKARASRKAVLTRSNIVNADGDKFRSTWELAVCDILIKYNIPYQREVPIKLISGKVKIVDFVIDSCIYIEVTGASYARNPQLFFAKITDLRESLKWDDGIILVSKAQLQKGVGYVAHNFINVFYCNLEETALLKSIKYFKHQNIINNRIDEYYGNTSI